MSQLEAVTNKEGGMKSAMLFLSAFLLVVAFGIGMFSVGMASAGSNVVWGWVAANFFLVIAAAFSVVGGVKSLPNSSLKRTDQSLRD